MTADKFRTLALSMSGAVESAHMGHPDFRAGGKIFATLGFPGDDYAMVKLTPKQQEAFMKMAPGVFSPCNGAWGRRGATQVHLKPARVGHVRDALEAAWDNLTATRKGD